LNEIFSARKLISLNGTLTLVAGIISAQQFTSLPPPWALVLGGVLAALSWVFRLRMPAAFLFGLVWALGAASFRLHGGLPPAMERRDVLVEGVVMDLPTRFDEGWRFIFKTDAVLEPEGSTLPRQFRLGWYDKDRAVKAGEHWRLRVRLKRPHGFFNAGGMDYELWMFSQGIRANGYVREDAKNQKLADASAFSVAGLRQSLFDALAKTLAGREMAGVVIALVMGTENAISQQQWEVLRRTGTAHLVAISGSHISLISGLVFLMVRLACARLRIMRRPPHSIAALAAFVAAFLYSALADFAIPTQRALVMIFVVMAAVVTQRNARPLHTLALALLAVSRTIRWRCWPPDFGCPMAQWG
jgi:competence protein ComEC